MTNDTKSVTFNRIMTAVVTLPVYVFFLAADYFYSLLILIASLVITLLSLHEYYEICDKGIEGKPFIIFGMTAGALANIIIYYYAFGRNYGFGGQAGQFDARIIFALIVLLLAVILIIQLFARPIKGGIYSLAVTVFGIIYIVFFFSHIILIKALQDGFLYILMLNIVIMVNDSAAYFGGISFGKHKTNFEVSPNKSWEGYFFGFLLSIIAMIAVNKAYAVFLNKYLFSFPESAVIGACLSILGHIGDLVESAIKRDAAKKDSGSLMPGHGGMWDVFDAMIFSMPFFYYYLILTGIN